MSTMTHQVFISYAREDEAQAAKLRDGLEARGVRVWFDRHDLEIGLWKGQIRRAIVDSRYFVICLSKRAIEKMHGDRAFQDTELDWAYSIAQDQDERAFTIIPVRLDDCGRGDHRLSIFQHFDLFEDGDATVDRLAIQLGGHALRAPAPNPPAAEIDLRQSLLWKAGSLYFSARYAEAAAVLDGILAACGPDKTVSHNKGVIHFEAGRFEAALSAFDEALALDHDFLPALAAKASVLVNLGRNAQALSICHKVLALEPRNSMAMASAAGALVGLEQPDQAVRFADAALALDTEDTCALANKAAALGMLGRVRDALAVAEAVLKIDPRCAGALNSKGNCLSHLGDGDAAAAAYREAIAVDPCFWTAHWNLAAVLDDVGKHRDAARIREMLDRQRADDAGHGEQRGT